MKTNVKYEKNGLISLKAIKMSWFGSGGLFVKYGFRGGGLFGRGLIREWGLNQSFTVFITLRNIFNDFLCKNR